MVGGDGVLLGWGVTRVGGDGVWLRGGVVVMACC